MSRPRVWHTPTTTITPCYIDVTLDDLAFAVPVVGACLTFPGVGWISSIANPVALDTTRLATGCR